MATIVIVHGGWGGGWEWTPVAGRLRERGHVVFTSTLTGLGERSHLGTDTTGLSDQIRDVLAILTFEELQDVVLCGHSYGGMVVTGAADRVPERIRGLGLISAEVRSSYLGRMRPHPASTMSEPIRLSGAVSGLPRAFVRCTGDLDPDTDVLGPFAARAQAEGWPYH